jgi:hypothetical protein
MHPGIVAGRRPQSLAWVNGMTTQCGWAKLKAADACAIFSSGWTRQ